MHLQSKISGPFPDASICHRCYLPSHDSITEKNSYAVTHEWTREMTLVRNQQAGVHVRLWQLLVLRNCDRWAKTTSLSPLLVSDFPEQSWSLFTGGHATGWTLKNVQCFYKNAHFLVFSISSTTKMIFSVGTEGGTKAWALDLTLKIIHTNSCPKIVTLHNPMYTNMLLQSHAAVTAAVKGVV